VIVLFVPPLTTAVTHLSLHDALPICVQGSCRCPIGAAEGRIHSVPREPGPEALRLTLTYWKLLRYNGQNDSGAPRSGAAARRVRSEEHTSELQSRVDLVCRLLLEKTT